MQYATIDDVRISHMTLGTVQLGLNYGVANTSGKPHRTLSMQVLEVAARNGINCFDTAPSYGDSEEIVGSFVSSYSDFFSPPVAVSKLPPIDLTGEVTPGSVARVVREHVVRSIERLRVSRIPIYLLHRASDMKAYDGLIIESLGKLKDEGLIGAIGASVYSPAEVEQALGIDAIQAIQLPVNIFDHRLISSGLLDDLRGRNITVFARSIFLQGLFFVQPGNLPPALKMAEQPLQQLHRMCGEQGMSVAQLALAFVRDLPGVTSLVVGAEKPGQVMENVSLTGAPRLPVGVRDGILTAFSNLPLEIVDPRMWNSNR